MNSYRPLSFLTIAFLLITPQLASQTASTNAVSFVYNAGQPAPASQSVTISGATGALTARISQNIDADGNAVTAASDNSGVFSDSVAPNPDGTERIAIGTNPYNTGVLAALAAKGPAGYRGTLLVSTGDCADCITIALYLQIGGSGSVSAFWNGQAATSGVTMAAAQGSIARTGLVLVTAAQTTYVAVSNQSWLIVAPTSGITGSGSAGSTAITLTAYATGLTGGSYYAVVTISTGVGAISIPVTFNVGYLSGLMLSPTAMTFQYVWNTQTYSWGQSSILAVTGAATGTGFTATSSTNWLLINGSTSASGILGTNVTISVNALALGNPPVPNAYTGYVYFYSNGLAGTLPITLTVTGTPASSASSLYFYAANSASAVAPQYVTIAGIGSYFTVVNRTSGSTNWLAASPASGTLTGTTLLGVTVNPIGLAPGTYYGTVQVYLAGTIYIYGISVAMTVGGPPAVTPVFSIGTHSMTFSYQQGGSVPPAQTVQASTNFGAAGFVVSSSVAWITATPASGTTPATLSISVNPSGLATGTQTGTVFITAPGAVNGSHTITVNLDVTSPPSLAMNTNSLAFTYRIRGPMPEPLAVRVSCTGSALPFTVSAPDAGWFSVTPSSATTPATVSFSVNPAGMALGQHTGTVNISAGASTHTISLFLTVMAELPTVTAVYNAASFQQGAIAPGEIITLTGSSLGPDTPAKLTVTDNRVNTSLVGTRVLVGGILAPLIYADQARVTAVVPYAMAGRSSTVIQVERDGQRSNGIAVEVAVTAPGIFTLNASGTGPGAVLNEDGSVNSPDNPAATGSVIMVFATGEGQTLPFGNDGRMASELTALPKPVLPVFATMNGTPVTVLYAGAAPHTVAGMLQVNILAPQEAGAGDVILTIGSKSSQAGVTVAVK